MDSYPAILASIGGEQRRLVTEKQWRRAIANRELLRDTPVRYEARPDDIRDCPAGEVGELDSLFEDMLGPVIASPPPTAEVVPFPIPERREAPTTTVRSTSSNGFTLVGAKPAQPLTGPRTAAPFSSPPRPQTLLSPAPTQGAMAGNASSGFGYMLLACKRFADFQGRSRRKEYWWFVIGSTVLTGLIAVLSDNRRPSHASAWLVLLWLVLLVPQLAVTVRRLHDCELTGWGLLLFMVVMAVPVLNIVAGVLFLLVMLSPGTKGSNKYGPDPKAVDQPG